MKKHTEEGVLGDSKVFWQIPARTSVVVNYHQGCFGILCGEMTHSIQQHWDVDVVKEISREAYLHLSSFQLYFFWTKLREEGGSLFHSHNSPLSGMAEVKDWIGPAETSVPLLCWTAVPLHTSTICCFLGSNAGREGVWTTVVRGGEMGRCRSMGNEPSLTFTAHEITNFARYCASQGQNLPSLTRQN